MENEWTPPSDGVAAGSSFVPPSDAVKKKDLTASGSVEPSSVRLTTTTTKATVSSSSKGKADGTYSFPGEDNAIYKKENGQWFKSFKGEYKYYPITKGDVQNRLQSLEKNAVSLDNYSFEKPEPKMPEVPKELQGDRNTIEYWDKLLAAGKVNKKTYDYHADRIASSDFGQAVTKAAAPKPKQTSAQKAEQELFKTSFGALDLNDPEYLRRKALSDKIDKSLSLVTTDFVNDNEGDVVPVVQQIIKDYPYLEVAESGFGYDELRIVNKVTGEDAVVNLENWSSGRDKEEANILRGFLDVQMNSKDYVEQKQKVDKLQAQMQTATPTQRIELSQKMLEEKAKLNELSTGRYNYAKNDKYKAAAIYDKNAKENIKTDFAKLQLQTIDYSEKAKNYNEWNATVNEARKNGTITEEQYNTEYAPKLEAEKNMLVEEKNKISEQVIQTKDKSISIDNIAANQYAIQAERGNVLSGATYSFLQGAENSLRFLLETGDFKDGEFKGLLTEAAPGSISDVYTSAEGRNAFEQIVFGLANSGGSALVGAAAGAPFLGLYASSYVNMKDQMSTPEFKDVPEYQKILMSGVYGATVGVLEKYGVSKWFTKTPAGKGLTNWILKKTISELGEDASAEAIELALKKNLGTAITNGLIQVTSAGVVEGSTELTQEAADMVYKDVFNKMAGKEYFQNPKTWAEVADRLGESFILGFAGGAGMQSITQATQVGLNELNKAQINNITDLIENTELKDTFKLHLKDQIISGEISKDEAKRQIDKINQVEGVLNKIPTKVDKFEAFKLITERDELQKEIAGKDPALVAAQTERVSAINDELKQLSYAVQEQATSEVSVQPGAESGGEMAQGKPETGPQEVTKEGEQEEIVDLPPTQNVGVLITPATVRNFSEETGRLKELSLEYDTLVKEYSDTKNPDTWAKVKQIESEILDNAQKEIEADVAKMPGIEVEFGKPRMGLWDGKFEPSFNMNLKISEDSDTTATSEMLINFAEKYSQDAFILETNSDLDAEVSNSNIDVPYTEFDGDGMMHYPQISYTFANNLSDQQIADLSNKLQDSGITAFSLNDQELKISVITFLEDNLSEDEQFTRKEQEFRDKLDNSADAIENILGDNGVYEQEVAIKRSSYQGAKNEGSSDQTRQYDRGDVLKSISKKEQSVADLSKKLSRVAQKDNLVTNDNINDIIDSQEIETRQKIAKSAKLVMKAIPEAKIYLHNNTDEYNRAIGEETDGTEKGSFIGKDMAIHIDMSEAFPHTLLHEAFHYVILNKGIDGKTLNAWAKSLKSIIKDKKLISRLDKLLKEYSAENQPEEFISELGAIIGAAKGQLTTSAFQKFKTLINKIAKAIGLPAIFTAASTRQDAVDFINTISRQLVTGDQIFANGFQTKIVPADLERKKQVKVTEDQKLTFVKQSDIIDFKSLIDDIISKDQTIWFWVADQLGRGVYFDSELNGNHYLDAGPSFALDPENRKDGIIWASGANKSTLEKNINNSDYIFIISGSPQQSKLFNKTVSSLVRSKIESKVDFDKFKSSILEAKPTKAIKEILEKYNSYDDIFLGADRKKFIIAINEQKTKGTPVKKLLESYDAFLETNELRDGFFKDNDFKMGDVMLVLKPTAVGGKSKHSTYENDILGEVIGVPNIIVNSYDIMPEEIRNKYRDDLDRAQQQQVVAPYGIGLKKIKQVSERKKQKGFSKQEAIRKAKEKYVLSVKERGNTPEQGVTSALEDLRKSEWYNEADDLMREEAERELKKFFGEKMKAAPSIKKVMAIKPTKIQVEEMAALKSQIRLEAKAAREAKGDLNTKRKALSAAITGMVRQGKITAVQARSIINKVSRVNLDNPVMVDRLISYAERVFDRADYQETLSKAAKIRKSIKKAMKSKDLQAEVAAVAKKFSSVDPFMVEDIDQYIENADKVLNAVRPVRDTEVPLRQAADIEAISDYTTAEVERQEANKKAELLALNKYLVEAGIVTDDMTAKEIQEMIDIIAAEEYEVENADKKLNFLKNRFEFMSGVIEEMIVNNKDIFTDEALDLTQSQKDLMREILKFDIDKLSVKQAAQVLEAMDNFINNGITSGLEAVVKGYIGNENANKLAASGLKSRPLRMYWNKAVGKFFGEQFVSLPLLIERMFPGMKKGLKLMSEMGLTDVIRGAAKADREHKMIVKDYTNQEFSKGKGFKKAENVYERGMIAFLSRNLAGTKTEMRNEFLRRVKMVEESINALMTGSETERKMGEAYQQVFDKLKVSSQDLDVIKANAEQMNIDAVNWMTQQWAEKYSDLSDISLSVYNAILGSDTNYTPDRYKGLDESDIELDEKLLQRGSAFMGGLEYTDKNKSGVLIETTRPKVLPEGRFVSLDFDVNNFSSLKGAMIDIETAPAIRQVDGFIKSDGYKRIVNGDDRKILNRRINNYIIAVKGKNAFNRDSMKSVERLANFLGSLGVGKALGGLDQTVKQTAPVIINTLINAGRFDGLNFEMNAAINRSGMPIANRGIEAISGVESIDALIDKKGTTAAEIAKAIEKVSQMYMKALLSKPDVWVARSSFISYYKNYLKTNGMSTNIDWQTHQWNQDAMNYAQMMVDRQQNISDEKLAGSFMNSPDSWKSVTRKVILPFATFIINQKNRMHNDFVALFGRGAETSLEDKKRAARSLGGLAAEMLAYQGIAYFIKTMVYDQIAAYITGEDDEEEKKERSFFGIKMTKKQWNATKFPVKSLVSDIVSPFPLFDDAVVFGFDELMSYFPMISKEDIDKAIQDQNDARALKGQDPMDAEQEANLIKNLKDKNTYAVTFQKESLGRQYGVPGIAFDTYTELADMAQLAYTGEFEDDMGFGPKKKYISKKDQELVKWTLLPMVLYSTGLVPKDAGVVSRKVVATVKKRSISETKFNNTNKLKTELGRKPKDWEESLVMNTTKKVPTLVEAIKFAERFGGLTESQGKEYAKLIEITGDYGYLDLKRIQEGETADQILKK